MSETTYTKNARLNVYMIKEGTKVREDGSKTTFWTKVGVAFVNSDGSFNVRLDAVPVDGRLHMRLPKESNGNGDGGETQPF